MELNVQADTLVLPPRPPSNKKKIHDPEDHGARPPGQVPGPGPRVSGHRSGKSRSTSAKQPLAVVVSESETDNQASDMDASCKLNLTASEGEEKTPPLPPREKKLTKKRTKEEDVDGRAKNLDREEGHTHKKRAAKNASAPPPQQQEEQPVVVETIQMTAMVPAQAVATMPVVNAASPLASATVTVYPACDLRNPTCVESMFSRGFQQMQQSNCPKTLLPNDSTKYTDVRFRLMGYKGEVQKLIPAGDGESKWTAVSYVSVRPGAAEQNVFGMRKPTIMDTFVAKQFQDQLTSVNAQGVCVQGVQIPPSLVQYPDLPLSVAVPYDSVKKWGK